MSIALRKANGDLYIDRETGQAEIVSGPTKVSQELFSLYTTRFDADRNWGSRLSMDYYRNMSSIDQLKMLVQLRLFEANNLMLSKQASDRTLDAATEGILRFSRATVDVDRTLQAAVFTVVADVGNPTTQVGQQLYLTYKPVQTNHVTPPPQVSGLTYFE